MEPRRTFFRHQTNTRWDPHHPPPSGRGTHLAVLVLAEVVHGIDRRLLEFWKILNEMLDVARRENFERRMVRVRQIDQPSKRLPPLYWGGGKTNGLSTTMDRKTYTKGERQAGILTNVPVLSGWALARRIESLTCHNCSSTFLSMPVAGCVGAQGLEAPTESLDGSGWFLVLRGFKKGALRNVPDADRVRLPITSAVLSYLSTRLLDISGAVWSSLNGYGAHTLTANPSQGNSVRAHSLCHNRQWKPIYIHLSFHPYFIQSKQRPIYRNSERERGEKRKKRKTKGDHKYSLEQRTKSRSIDNYRRRKKSVQVMMVHKTSVGVVQECCSTRHDR